VYDKQGRKRRELTEQTRHDRSADHPSNFCVWSN